MLSVRRGPLARALGRSKSVILRNRSSICNTLLALRKMIQIPLSLLVKVSTEVQDLVSATYEFKT